MSNRIKVYPNKWLALDALGNPCAVVPIDFNEHGQGRKWVGCKLAATLTKAAVIEKVGKIEQEVSAAVYDSVWTYADGPVEIPLTGYYVARIKSGDLLIADEESAKTAAVPYSDPLAALEAAKALAVKGYDAQHGEGAWAALNAPAKVEPIEAPKDSPANKGGRKSSTPQE